jgi:hypothetical protein
MTAEMAVREMFSPMLARTRPDGARGRRGGVWEWRWSMKTKQLENWEAKRAEASLWK